MLIYNSQSSDPISQKELAAATEIYCSKGVAQSGLGSNKSWVAAANLSVVFAISTQTSLSREQVKEIKVKDKNGCGFCSS